MNSSTKSSLSLIAGLALVACGASSPSTELQTAREAYQKSQHSQTAQVKPAELRVAQRTLQQAEAAYEEEPGSAEERHLAYVALRQVEFANARANAELAEMRKKQNQETYERELRQEAQTKREYASNLQDARQQLAQIRSEMQQQGQELSSELQQKERELAAHVEKLRAAEAKAAEARKLLEEMAENSEEIRPLVEFLDTTEKSMIR